MPMPLSYDDQARQVAEAVQQEAGVDTCLLFGSRARGSHHAHSDIDLLVVHSDTADAGDLEQSCRRTARQAVQRLYGIHLDVDIVVLSTRLFSIMQAGRNHVAARAVQDGVTPMGFHYRPTSGDDAPEEQPLQESHRLEAMERCYSAVDRYDTLQVCRQSHPPNTHTLSFGNLAQQVLENSLKALIAAYGQTYKPTHNLERLWMHTRTLAPDLELSSPLRNLSQFAGTDIYFTPTLAIGTNDLCDSVDRDLREVFTRIQERCGFDPWSVERSDFLL